MTQWGLDALFNPAKRHMDEEKQRLEATREEVGDSSGGQRIDLESGRVTIRRGESEEDPDRDTDADGAAEADADGAAEADEADPPRKGSPSRKGRPPLTEAQRRAALRRGRKPNA